MPVVSSRGFIFSISCGYYYIPFQNYFQNVRSPGILQNQKQLQMCTDKKIVFTDIDTSLHKEETHANPQIRRAYDDFFIIPPSSVFSCCCLRYSNWSMWIAEEKQSLHILYLLL